MGAQGKAREGRRAPHRGDASASPPDPSILRDLPDLSRLACSDRQLKAFDAASEALVRAGGAEAKELALGCVVRLDRGFPAVMTKEGVRRAEFSAQLSKGSSLRVAVGDWVCLRRPKGHGMALIQEILPRTSDLVRWRGGARGERQTLAANVDVVLVVQALGAEAPSCNRIVRSAIVARDCGAEVAVVLTKADRTGPEGVRDYLRLLRAVMGEGLPVAVTAASAGEDAPELRRAAEAQGAVWGREGVRRLVCEGAVAIMLGESGVGKSTLLNALLGRAVLETGPVRASDDAGRHTTVARRMVQVPGAGVIVDAPGLRSLPLVGHERGLALVFPKIAEAARKCRFRDCTHTHEPGCEVRLQGGAGAFSPERLEAYVSLAAEMRESAATLDPDVVI